MMPKIPDSRLANIKQSLFNLCHESGILADQNIDDFYHADLIESGIIDSMGVVLLQDQIETYYKVTISLDQFIAELRTLAKVVNFLAADSTVHVSV